MPDIFNRAEAPLTPVEWDHIDRIVVETARKALVGRRFVDVSGPLGAGVQTAPSYIYTGTQMGEIKLLPEDDPNPLRAQARMQPVIPVIYKDFQLYWRDIETARTFNIPMDLSAAAAAAAFVAQREDDLIINGNAELGYTGLTTAEGREVLPQSNWETMGSAFADAVAAMQRLVSEGFFGPFAMVVSPIRFANMARVYENTGVLEIEQVRKIMTAGVFSTPVIADNVVLVVSTGPQNFDLIVAQDYTVAYLTQNNLNHPFRVLESVLLQIHRPGAICTLEAGEVPAEEGREKRRR